MTELEEEEENERKSEIKNRQKRLGRGGRGGVSTSSTKEDEEEEDDNWLHEHNLRVVYSMDLQEGVCLWHYVGKREKKALFKALSQNDFLNDNEEKKDVEDYQVSGRLTTTRETGEHFRPGFMI